MSFYRCAICNINTMFYIWSSSRDFPREKLAEIDSRVDISLMSEKERKVINNYYRVQAKPVCIWCCKEKLGMDILPK